MVIVYGSGKEILFGCFSILQLEQNRTVSRQRNRTQTILAGDGKRLSGAAELRGIAVKQNRKLRQGSGEVLFAVRKLHRVSSVSPFARRSMPNTQGASA